MEPTEPRSLAQVQFLNSDQVWACTQQLHPVGTRQMGLVKYTLPLVHCSPIPGTAVATVLAHIVL